MSLLFDYQAGPEQHPHMPKRKYGRTDPSLSRRGKLQKAAYFLLFFVIFFGVIAPVFASGGIMPDYLPDAIVGRAYSVQLSWPGQQPPITWSVVSGILPPRLSLGSTTGLISGVPAVAGTYRFRVGAQKHVLTRILSEDKDYTLAVSGEETPITIYPDSLPKATEGTAYSVSLFARGGTPPYTWSVAGLPRGLGWEYLAGPNKDSITVYGVPDGGTRGTYMVDVAVRDSRFRDAVKRYILIVGEAPWRFSIILRRLAEGVGTTAVVYVDSLVLDWTVPEMSCSLFELTVRRTGGIGDRHGSLLLIIPSGEIIPNGVTVSLSPSHGTIGDQNLVSIVSIKIDRRYPHLSEEREIRLIIRTIVTGVEHEDVAIRIAIKGLEIDLRIQLAQPIQVVSSSTLNLVAGKSTVFNVTYEVVCNRMPVLPVRFKITLALPTDKWEWESAAVLEYLYVYNVIIDLPRTDFGGASHRVVRKLYLPLIRPDRPGSPPKPLLRSPLYARGTKSYTSFQVYADFENRVVERDERNNLYDRRWVVQQTRSLSILFYARANGTAENKSVWWRHDRAPDHRPPYSSSQQEDYFRYSREVDVDGDGDREKVGLFGAWTVDLLVSVPSRDGYLKMLNMHAGRLVEYVLDTYPIADDRISYSIASWPALVTQECGDAVEEVARSAKIWGYDVGVVFRICGSGGSSWGTKWAVFTDIFAHDATLAHEFYHLLAPMNYDDYDQHPASPGYWVNRGEVRGVGESYFMAGGGISYPDHLIGGTDFSRLSQPPYFEWAWQSKHWIQEDMYKKLIDGWFELNTYEDPPAVLVSGTVFRNGSAYLKPLLVREVERVDLMPNSSESYRIILLDGKGNILATYGFNASFAILGDPIRTETDRSSFSYYVEMVDGVKSVELRDAAGKTLASRSVSPNAPSISLTSPLGGERLNTLRDQTFSITWSASDPDGDKLYYYVAISPDNGKSWLPLGIDLTDTKFSVDMRFLEPGNQYIVNVKASDGFNMREVFSKPFGIGAYVELKIMSDAGGVTGSGWYFKGENATVSIAFTKRSMDGILGLLGGYYEFKGWSGDLTSTATSATILMDRDKTATAVLRADYTMPIVYIVPLAIAILAVVVLVRARRK